LLLLGLLAPLAALAVVDRTAVAGARRAVFPVTGSTGAVGGAGLHVIPFPGTPDASPSSGVIFLSLVPAELRSVTVEGSRSGAHNGQVEALPDGAGTAFVPRRAFRPGERVQVVARLSSPAAGTASGAPGATHLGFSFGVAVTGSTVQPPSDGLPSGTAAKAAHGRSFHSEPGLHPPAVSVSSDPDTRSGDIFLTPAHTREKGPMILNSRGQLVWFHRIRHGLAFNLEVQSYRGRRVLTWWQGRYGRGGEDVIMDRSYHTVAVLRAGNGYLTDPHDFQLTPQGTAWVVARTSVQANLSSVGGPSNGYVWDSVIQKLAIPSGKVLWEWHAYGHIPLNASHERPSGSYCDCFHLNSIQPLPDGDLLVSSRSTWSVYKVSVKTGHVLWTLGGKYNDFKMGSGTQFEWQHDAHKVGNTLTLFDDAASPEEQPQSSAKVLHLNVSRKTVTLIHRYTHSPPLLSPAQGSTQVLPNGNVFVGWGSEPDFSEYSPRGQQIFTGSFALGTTSYRAFRFPWRAHPHSRPKMATSEPTKDGVKVWASWNGATNVAAWRVLGGSRAGSLGPLITRPDTGFETRIGLTGRPRYVEVQALNRRGKVSGTSVVHPLG
jgi:hypothetical protein